MPGSLLMRYNLCPCLYMYVFYTSFRLLPFCRTDLLIYPSYTTQHRMLCTADNFNSNNDVFSASIKVQPKSKYVRVFLCFQA